MSIRCRACVRVDTAVQPHLVHPQYGAHGDEHNSITSSASVSYQISVVSDSVRIKERQNKIESQWKEKYKTKQKINLIRRTQNSHLTQIEGPENSFEMNRRDSQVPL